MPVLALLATLALVLVVPRRVPLWISFLAACLLLPPLSGKGMTQSFELWKHAATSSDTLLFTAVCAGVFVLSSILTHGGHLAALCDFASVAIPSRRIRAAVMPALVGLVPMPGGAVVSAPLIERSLGGADVSPTDKNLINYWFRHIWEVSWPLYPSVLLAVGYAEGDEGTFFLAQAALTVLLAVAGYVVLLRRVRSGAPVEPTSTRPPIAHARAALPLLVLIALPLFLRAPGATPAYGLLLGNLVAIAVAIATTIRFEGLKDVPFDRRIWSMTALALLVKAFGDLVSTTGASAEVATLIGRSGLPFEVAVALLPFVVGFASGATLTFVTVAFPILLPTGGVPWLVLAYAGGFVGYLTSPVHMCLVLSTRYFNSRMVSAYSRLAVPLLLFLGAAIALFLILRGRFEP